MKLERFTLTMDRLGSDWEIQYFAAEPVNDILKIILEHVDHFTGVFSRFDPNSQLSKLNRDRNLEADDEFIALFERADFFYHKTHGIFNPLATPAHFGYTSNFDDGRFTSPKSQTPNLNWNEIIREGKKLTLATGQLLDFGGIGKGYLIDELAALLQKYSNHFMINGGGDIWIEGGKPDGSLWQIAVENPMTGEMVGVIPKATGAFATSGVTRLSWEKFNHLIDSRTNLPVENAPLSLTVTADSACTADVGATTLICSFSNEYEALAECLDLEYGYFLDEKFWYSKNLGISN